MQALTLDAAELAGWLRLSTTPGVSRRRARRLLAHFGLPPAIFAASYAQLCALAGDTAAAALQRAPHGLEQQLAATVAWLAQAGCHLLTLADPAYPPRLLETPDPPTLLYVRGKLAGLHQPGLAVVGSRHASAQGLAHARSFAQAFAQAGLAVISGMALGVDGAAHEGALAAGGVTVAVLGTGVDRIYPARHRALAEQLAEHGTLVSEWPLGTQAKAAHFPQRNRLIAGLAHGVLVVEAAAQSGSLITAHLANDMGRDVYAIPGSIHSALSRGCHRLIKEGARLVESVADVLDDLAWVTPIKPAEPAAPVIPVNSASAAQPVNALNPAIETSASWHPANAVLPRSAVQLDPQALRVLQALGSDAAPPDLLAERTGLEPARLQAALLQLELAGCVTWLACGRVAPHFSAAPGTHPSHPEAG